MALVFAPQTVHRQAGPVGKSRKVVTGILVVDSPAGAEAGDIPASLFGLTTITEASAIVNSSDDEIYVGVPSYDGESLLVRLGVYTGGETPDYDDVSPGDLPAESYRLTVTGH